MRAKSDPHNGSAGSEYFYRRSLSAGEMLPAIGAGIAIGLLAFYVARTVIQRTPLAPELVDSRRALRRRQTSGG